MNDLLLSLFLFILTVFTLYASSKCLSLISAFLRRSLPHLLVESISIAKFKLGIKKSNTKRSIGFCISNSTSYLSNMSLNCFSCGSNLLNKVLEKVCALFSANSFSFIGLSFFILSLWLFASSEFSLVLPNIKWLLPLFLVSLVASLTVRVFNPKLLAICVSPCRLILHSFASSFKDRFSSRCNLFITSSKDILKYFSTSNFLGDVILDDITGVNIHVKN